MASIIRIKRSSTAGNPGTLGAGELAYSAVLDTTNGGSVSGGQRLYIGIGTETDGNAPNHIIIGGEYYTSLIDNSSSGTLTTNKKSIPILSASGTINKWYVGNVYTTGNTITTTNTDGDLVLNANGTGKIKISNSWTLPTSAGSGTTNYILTSGGDGTSSWVAPASQTITLAAGSGSGSVNTGGTLTVSGGNGIVTTVSGSTITISSTGAGGYTSTLTGAGTTTLSSSSSANQFFTGTSTQTVKLPDTSTLALGQEFFITNNSTGDLAIQTSAGGSITTILAKTQATFTVASTAAQTWVAEITGFNASTGSGSVVLASSPTLTTPSFSSIINTGTLTLPTSTDTLVGKATSDTFTNKTINIKSGQGNTFQIQDNSITSYTGSGAVVMLSATPSITGAINYGGSTSGQTSVQASAVASGTLTLPAATDTLVGKATTDTFTNKTFDTADTGNVLKINGTQVSAVTGSGSVVLATSPTLVTPTLGAATATTINKVTITAPSSGSTLTIANSKTLTASNSVTFTATDTSGAVSVDFAAGGTVAYTGTALNQFASTTSAQLATVISDETGSGVLVFGTAPTFTTSIDGGSTFTAFASPTSLTIGGGATTLTLGYSSTAASTTNISTGAVAASTTKTINIGTGGAASSTTNINLGSANGGTVTVNKDLVVSGNFTVNGTTTTVNSTTLTVDDVLIELGSVATPSDVTAAGGGIKLYGTTDKTITWGSTNGWTSSESFNLVTGKTFKINGADVLSGSTLGSGVTSSSLTSVGTITTGTWSATTIASNKGGTGFTTYTTGDLIYASAANTLSKLSVGVSTDGQVLQLSSGVPVWGDIDGGTY